jgi:hypothetical protein
VIVTGSTCTTIRALWLKVKELVWGAWRAERSGDIAHVVCVCPPLCPTVHLQAKVASLLYQRQAEEWAKRHGAHPPRRKLAPAVLKVPFVFCCCVLKCTGSAGSVDAKAQAMAQLVLRAATHAQQGTT